MEKFYLVPTFFSAGNRSRDFYLFSTNPEYPIERDDYLNIGYSFDGNLIYFEIEKTSGFLAVLSIPACKNVNIYNNNFPKYKFLSFSSEIALSLDHIVQQYYRIPLQPSIEIYKDTIVINIPTDSAKGPCYLVIEKNKSFGALVNQDLVILAFVLFNISSEEMLELKQYRYQNQSPETYHEQKNNLRNLILMENKNCLIQKVIELKNVNNWHVLYYAYQRTLIDDDFLIDYAMELLSQNLTNDPKILELAGLLDSEKGQAEKTFENFVKKEDKEKILYAESPFYNKIWFYLILASEMCERKIID